MTARRTEKRTRNLECLQVATGVRCHQGEVRLTIANIAGLMADARMKYEEQVAETRIEKLEPCTDQAIPAGAWLCIALNSSDGFPLADSSVYSSMARPGQIISKNNNID